MVKPKTHVVFLLDKSGSMGKIRSQAVEYYNEQRQQIIENSKDQDITVSLFTFNSNVFEHELLVPANELPEITLENYVPNGGTAWYDAMGYAITKLQEITEADENTAYLIVSITDGKDFNSRYYGTPQDASPLRKLISECECSKRWTFSYLGCSKANLDHVAKEVGIPLANMGLWNAESETTAAASLQRSTVRSKNFYAARAAGQLCSVNYYSDVDAVADFTQPVESIVCEHQKPATKKSDSFDSFHPKESVLNNLGDRQPFVKVDLDRWRSKIS